ncbi:MAG: hypothetical protein HOK35_08570 [Cytophagia bacterium]|jgi:hypothetical protein|nr:hypothetical protein [Cytophagia bacterium]
MVKLDLLSLSKNLNSFEKGCFDFLGESANSLRSQIKDVIPNKYNQLELLFFVDYVVVDVFSNILLDADTRLKIRNEFLYSHLFHVVTFELMLKSNSPEIELNRYSKAGGERMNEYKNLYSISELFQPDFDIENSLDDFFLIIEAFLYYSFQEPMTSKSLTMELYSIISNHIDQQFSKQSELLLNELSESLKSSNSSNVPAKSGCFVATYLYGGVETTQVNILRDFRDSVLIKSIIGRLIVKIYYKVGPMAVRLIKKMPIIKIIIRSILDRLILFLSKR